MKRTGDARGFTLLEMLVAVAVAGVILGAAFKLFIEDSQAYHDQMQIAEMRQNARSAVEFLTRDVMPVGYGLLRLNDTVSVLIANEPAVLNAASTTAITVRYNSTDVWTTLSDPMPQPSSELKCVNAAGFVDGQRVLIWDDTGTYDWLVITHDQLSPDHLQHNTTDCSKSYDPADNTQIATISEISFRWDATKLQLQRAQDGGPWIAIAENVDTFALRYWDGAGTELFPATDAARRAVRQVSVSLRVRTAEKDRGTRQFKNYSVSTQMTPRNLRNYRS